MTKIYYPENTETAVPVSDRTCALNVLLFEHTSNATFVRFLESGNNFAPLSIEILKVILCVFSTVAFL